MVHLRVAAEMLRGLGKTKVEDVTDTPQYQPQQQPTKTAYMAGRRANAALEDPRDSPELIILRRPQFSVPLSGSEHETAHSTVSCCLSVSAGDVHVYYVP